MTYKFTLVVPESESVVEEGEIANPSDLLVSIKRQFARFMFVNHNVSYSKVTIEFVP